MNSTEEAYKNGAAVRREPEADGASLRFRRARDNENDVLAFYARTLLRRPKTILIPMIIAAAITGFVSKYHLTKWYKATVIIRPVAESTLESQIMGLTSAFGAGPSGGLSGLIGSVTGGTGGDAEQYVAILKSFFLTRSVIEKHRLMSDFLPPDQLQSEKFESSRHLQWRAYRVAQNRLSVEYSMKTGNITLEFQDLDPAQAERVLGYYVDDFRELLRQRQHRDVKTAVKSMEAEAARTADTTLQQALYQFVANQIQRETLSEVESDFAFTIIEPPAASDQKVWPPTAVLCLVAAFVTFAMVATYILFIGPSARGQRAALLLPDDPGESPGGEERKRPSIPDHGQRPVP
jgi:hypothetical protein